MREEAADRALALADPRGAAANGHRDAVRAVALDGGGDRRRDLLRRGESERVVAAAQLDGQPVERRPRTIVHAERRRAAAGVAIVHDEPALSGEEPRRDFVGAGAQGADDAERLQEGRVLHGESTTELITRE